MINLVLNADQVRVILGATALSCGLGVAIDLVTAHVAVEYFTVHHPKVVESQEPLVMALVWGVLASWWFGAIAGLVLAVYNRRQPRPVSVAQLLRWVARGCFWIWATMMVVLLATFAVSELVPEAKRRASYESDRRLMSVAMAHLGEYAFGAVVLIRITRQVKLHGKNLGES